MRPFPSAPPTTSLCNVPQEAEVLANCPSLHERIVFFSLFESYSLLNQENDSINHHVHIRMVVRLTTSLLIAVVSAVVVAVANRPQWHAAVVGLAAKLSMVVTPIRRSHCKKDTTVFK